MTTLTKKIAVVDDDLEIRELVEAFFRQKDLATELFEDAEQALEALKKNRQAWDAILVDLNLPTMNGIEFTQEAKKMAPDVPIILITTNKSAEMALKAIEQGAYDFIVKPIHFPQLYISVQRALHLKNLQGDLSELRTHVKTLKSKKNHSMIGKSPRFLEALEIAGRVAKSLSNIFINGESGTGKEVFAKYIHEQSKRASGPFVAINCSAIPENLLESELFGHAKGSFTGAHDKKIGLFEEAQDGTLFLDEIGDLSLSLQAKLLRVLQEKKIKRVGENQSRTINCRIVSATHKDLVQEIKEGRFREDLYFRLNVIPVAIPPLRERREDILPLAENFLRKYALENGSLAKRFSKDSMEYLLANSWPGNVRELENAVERAVVLSADETISLDDFMFDKFKNTHALQQPSESMSSSSGFFIADDQESMPPLDDVINQYIAYCVHKNQGARDKTAKQIGIDRKTLYKRLSKWEAQSLKEISI